MTALAGLVATGASAVVSSIFGEPGTIIASSKAVGSRDVVVLDVTITETSTTTSTVTEHPIEDGSTIADHIKDEPDELQLEGIITNTPANLLQALGASPTRSEDEYFKLIDLKDRKETVSVLTTRRVFDDMVITKIGRTRNAAGGDAAVISITLRKISTVQAQTVAAPVRPAKKKLGKKASETPNPAQRQSFLHAILGG